MFQHFRTFSKLSLVLYIGFMSCLLSQVPRQQQPQQLHYRRQPEPQVSIPWRMINLVNIKTI